MNTLIRFACRNGLWVLAGILLVSLLAATQLRHLTLDVSLRGLMI